MSDFDKEAEREKLREKYERDEAERRATQQMSELLLQGATMTNAHCDDHGDPIFRYDGDEFCPTCRAEGRETGRAGDDEEGEAAEGDGTPEAGDEAGGEAVAGTGQRHPSEAGTERRSRPGAGEEPRTRPDADEESAPEASEKPRSPSEAGAEARSLSGVDDPGRPPRTDDEPQSLRTDRPTGEDDRREGRSRRTGGRPRGGAADELAEAEASLRRTLVRFARRAEGTDDPRRAREDLRVAREAAETLAALND